MIDWQKIADQKTEVIIGRYSTSVAEIYDPLKKAYRRLVGLLHERHHVLLRGRGPLHADDLAAVDVVRSHRHVGCELHLALLPVHGLAVAGVVVTILLLRLRVQLAAATASVVEVRGCAPTTPGRWLRVQKLARHHRHLLRCRVVHAARRFHVVGRIVAAPALAIVVGGQEPCGLCGTVEQLQHSKHPQQSC